MQVAETPLAGVNIVEPKLYPYMRGYFLEVFSAAKYGISALPAYFVQDNLSFSRKHTLRGLHFQNPNQRGKLVMVLSAAIVDVAVDVRKGSPTFAKHVSVVLEDKMHRQLWMPRGFAHGFLVLSDEARLFYKCDAPYDRESELSIRWNDPDLDIDWPAERPLLSDKDATAPLLRDLTERLPVYEG
jgi:dTDP-4-dehydrorhamnose 3,5-epimerase